MPEEEQIDEVVAAAMGLAAYHLQNSLLTALVAKGYLTMKEAALTVSGAAHSLDELRPTPLARPMVVLAKQSLTTLAQSWETQARGH